MVTIWLFLVLSSYSGRKILVNFYHRNINRYSSPLAWLHRYRIATFFCGLSWGMLGLICFPNDFTDQALATMVLGGVCGGGIVVYSIDKILAYGFTGAILVPVLPYYLINATAHAYAFAFVLVLFVLYVLISAFRNAEYLHKTIFRSIDVSKAIEQTNGLVQRQKLHIDNTPMAVVECDSEFRVTAWNRAAENIFGYSSTEAINKHISFIFSLNSKNAVESECELLFGRDSTHVRQDNVRKDGSVICCEWFITQLKSNDEHMIGTASLIQDVTAHKYASDQIQRLAYYDPLTNLPNRRLLHDRLGHTLNVASRTLQFGCIMFMDLDNFKVLNDTKGHATGDILLIEVAKRLQSLIRVSDTVARLGGDEFVIVLENLGTTIIEAINASKQVGNKIIEEINRPYHFDKFEHHCSPSIGIAFFPDKNISVEEILKHADCAMYQSKQSGRNRYTFYDESMQPQIDYVAKLKIDMQFAIERRQLALNFQPQVNHLDEVTGAEVLLRWTHPIYENISPQQFIPLAEETGQIIAIGNWVIKEACRILNNWESKPSLKHINLSVNMSAFQLSQPEFVQNISDIIAASGCSPSRLRLELTESMVIENIDDAIIKLEQLKKMGVKLSLDDFGVGYSSLSILSRLPIDEIKIDQSFIRGLTMDNLHNQTIIQAIMAICDRMGLSMIAEGVETDEQRMMLTELGCKNFQGYLFGRPVPRHEFEKIDIS